MANKPRRRWQVAVAIVLVACHDTDLIEELHIDQGKDFDIFDPSKFKSQKDMQMIQINTNHAIQLLNHSCLILKNNRELSARESSTQEGCG